MNTAYRDRKLIDITGEKWRDIIGYESLYAVSNMGRIKSLSRVVARTRKHRTWKSNEMKVKEKVIAIRITPHGYCEVKLTKLGVFINAKVHRLVAIAFIPNHQNKPRVNHLFGVKTDNRVSQLEWATASEDISHAFRLGLNKSSFQKFGAGNPKSKPVSQYDLNGVLIKTFPGQAEASRKTGVDQSIIWHVCNGKRKTGGGYIWKYTKGYSLGRRGGSIHEKISK